MPKRAHIVLASIFGLLLAACATQPDTPTVDELATEVAGFIATDQLRDDRGRFREIFCAVLEARGEEMPDYRNCEEAIRETGPEAGATGAGVKLGQSEASWALSLHFGEWSWRWMLGLEALPAVIYFFCLWLVPESPRWWQRRRHDQNQTA